MNDIAVFLHVEHPRDGEVVVSLGDPARPWLAVAKQGISSHETGHTAQLMGRSVAVL